MTISVETLDERNHREGNNFTRIFTSNDTEATTHNLVMFTGSKNIVLNKVEIGGTSPHIKFNLFAGTDATKDTGTVLNELPANETVNSTSGAQMELNPTIISNGQSILGTPGIAIDLMGMAAYGGNVAMRELIITKKLTRKMNSKTLFQIANQHTGSSSVYFTVHYTKV